MDSRRLDPLARGTALSKGSPLPLSAALLVLGGLEPANQLQFAVAFAASFASALPSNVLACHKILLRVKLRLKMKTAQGRIRLEPSPQFPAKETR